MILYFGAIVLGLLLYTALFYLFLLWRLTTAPNEALYRRVFLQEPRDYWRQKQFSYYHLLKALRSIKLSMPIFRAVDCQEDEFRALLPILLHTEGRIYVTDLSLERSLQNRESYVDTPLTDDLIRFLSDYGYYDEKIGEAVEDLQRYAACEIQMMLNQIEITDERIRDLCFRRGCDVYLLLRILCKAKNLPYPQEDFHLEKCMIALGEIQDDLSSYPKDVQENSINLLRLCVRRHGTEKGLEKLKELARSIVDEAIGAMKTVDKRHIVQCAGAYIEMELGIPFVLAKPLFAFWPRIILVKFMNQYVGAATINAMFANAPQPVLEQG